MNFKFALIIGSISVVAVSQAALVMDQIGSAPSNLDPANNFVFNSQRYQASATQNNIASLDNFTLASSTNLTSAEGVFVFFHTGNSSFNSVTNWSVEIYSSVAAAGGNLTGDIYHLDVTSPSITQNYFTPLLNGQPTNQGNGLVNIPINVTLGAGTYYVAMIASLDSSVDQIGVSKSVYAAGFPNGLDAQQANPANGFGLGTTFQAMDDNGQGINLAYRLNGTVVPEPASMAALATGALVLLRRRRNKKA